MVYHRKIFSNKWHYPHTQNVHLEHNTFFSLDLLWNGDACSQSAPMEVPDLKLSCTILFVEEEQHICMVKGCFN